MKKNYKDTDEIELRLYPNISDHYWLEWRFKEPRKFLFFKINDKWKSIRYYSPGIFTPDDDPNREYNWYWRGFHMGRNGEVEEYDNLIKKVKTKEDLYKHFHVKENLELYERHLKEHNKWLEETNKNIEKYVK